MGENIHILAKRHIKIIIYNIRNHNLKYHLNNENGGPYHRLGLYRSRTPQVFRLVCLLPRWNKVYDSDYRKREKSDVPLEEKISVLADFMVYLAATGMFTISIIKILAIAGLCAV